MLRRRACADQADTPSFHSMNHNQQTSLAGHSDSGPPRETFAKRWRPPRRRYGCRRSANAGAAIERFSPRLFPSEDPATDWNGMPAVSYDRSVASDGLPRRPPTVYSHWRIPGDDRSFNAACRGSSDPDRARFLRAAAQGETRLMRFRTSGMTRWSSPTPGTCGSPPRRRPARRLTAHPGDELYPKFSPTQVDRLHRRIRRQLGCVRGPGQRRRTQAVDLSSGQRHGAGLVAGRPHPVPLHAGQRPARLHPPVPDFAEGGLPEMLSIPRASLASFSADGQRIATT